MAKLPGRKNQHKPSRLQRFRSVARRVVGDVTNAAASTATAIAESPRGIRNNNPGNIRRTSDRWRGQSATQNDAEFVQFDSPVDGIRALVKVLRSYKRAGVDTVRGIIQRYAPPSENDTGAYAQHVASRLGVGLDTPIDVENKKTAHAIVVAITRHENKNQFPYAFNTVDAGVDAGLA